MKKFFMFLAGASALLLFVSCQKQQTEAEKNAEVERQVQERLAAEHQTQQQQELQQRQAELDAREKALAEKEREALVAETPSEQSESQTLESREPRVRTRAPQGEITTGYTTFYNKLESHGDWIETGDYGYVFQPREAANARWRPYTNGRWVYTDAGWTWISEEPFGWATYHYGRWTRLRGIGWVWVPGNQWAPAWVSWRKSNDYVGWAPLPPEARFDQRTGIHNWSDNYYDIGPDQYCFVASREFGAPRVEQTLLPPERSVTIVNQTTNVTNITYNNTTIVNEGPNYDEMRSVTREPIQRYRLERNVNVDLSVGNARPEVRGETVVVAAPVISAPVAKERPQTVKQTITTATVDLGWAAISNQEEAKKARQKMKSEAAPPSNAPSKKFVKAEAAMSTTGTSSPTSTAAASTSAPTTTTATPAATIPSTPAATRTPRPAATVAPAATMATTSPPISSPVVSPTVSQRRGRLLLPSATPGPRTPPNATARPTAANSPVASDTIPSTKITPPVPEGSPLRPTGSPQGEMTREKFKSQAQKFNPRKVEPMPSASAAASAASSPNAVSNPSITPPEKLTKQEKKEQKREEKREMKRERKEGNAPASPSATP